MIEILLTLNLFVLLVFQGYSLYSKIKSDREMDRVSKELRQKLTNLEETARKFFEENNKPEESTTNEQVVEENIEVAKKKPGRPKKDDTK